MASKPSINRELKLSVLKRITGRQDPSIIRIFCSIVVAVVFFFLVFFAGFLLNKAMIPLEANAVFNPFIRDGYIPIEITNGLKELKGASLNIKTCYMNEFEEIPISDLVPNQDIILAFRNKETFLALDKLYSNPDFNCEKNNISTSSQCWIKSFIVKDKLYAPPQECINYRCGECEYTLIIKSSKGEIIYENINSFPPIEVKRYNLNIFPTEEMLNFNEENSTFFSFIGVSVYTEKDLCILNNESKCEELPDTVNLDKDLTLEISPKNKSLGNLEFNLSYSKI